MKTWYEVFYCGDMYSERFESLTEARKRAIFLRDEEEYEDVHIMKVEEI